MTEQAWDGVSPETVEAMTGHDVEKLQDWHRGDWMQTFTGRAFYPLDPRASEINSLDIAHSLAMQCRYNGHVQRFYSVAEHCVLLCDYVLDQAGLGPDEAHDAAPEVRRLALWALLHDAGEAYVGDMVRPLKRSMPDFCAAEDRIMTSIAVHFGLPDTRIPDEVRDLDTRILLDERAALLRTSPHDWGLSVEPLGVTIRAWVPSVAKREYLRRLGDLTD